MLTLFTDDNSRNNAPTTRRGFLRIASLGLGGLSLPNLLAVRALAAESGSVSKDTSVVLLFLTGGPSQIETFDPKMSAPADVRSVTGEVQTNLPGVTFGGTFPQLARRAERLAVVRSFTHGNSDHTGAVEEIVRGRNATQAGIGSVVARLKGATDRATGMPTHVYLGQLEQDTQFDKERLRLLAADGPGQLGTAYAPFEPLGAGDMNRNLELNIPLARMDDRRSLLQSLDRFRWQTDGRGAMEGLDVFAQQARELILGRAKTAFDLTQEDPRLVARYDTRRFNTALRIASRPSPLGHHLLLARRLCEAGCGFVTVHDPGWDMHGGDTQFNMPNGMERLGRPLDHAVATFLDDVAERGLSEKILLIITGEFGRTPRVKPDGGRDHWPQLSTLAFAGGGLRMGQVIGQSNPRAESPQSRPVTIEEVMATVLHVLLDVPKLRLLPSVPRDIARTLERAEPIAELI